MPQRQAGGGGGQQVGQGQGQVQGQQFIHPSASAAAAAAHYYRLPAGSGGGSMSSSSSAGGAGGGSNALASQQQQQQRLSPPSLTAPSPPLYSSSSHQNHHPPQHHSHHHPYHPQHPQHHQHQHHHHPPPTPSSSSSPSSSSNPSQIIDVYADTLESELVAIRDAIEIYPFVAFDTEFPGVVARPIGHFKSTSDYHYQTLRSNVDLLRIIQLGVTLSDENGNLAEPVSTWQFNFKFSLDEDMYAPESIDLLTNSGINFKKHQEYGIDVESFGELLISSGLVLFDDVKWISFHSGYDFGYLLKLVSCAPLPPTEAEFFELLKIWFPCIYDIKFLMRSCKSLKGGLQDVADELQVPRIGPQHQAGSDSLLTSATFFKMRSRYFEDDIDPKYLGNLYGLGSSSTLFHQTSSSGSGSGSVPGGISSTPQLQSALPTPGGMSALVGPPIPPVASAALPIKDPFGASPFKLQQGGSMVSTPGGTLADLPHASSPSPGSGLRGL